MIGVAQPFLLHYGYMHTPDSPLEPEKADYLASTIQAYEKSPAKYIQSTQELIWQKEVDRFATLADLHPGDPVLDAGCAFGRDCALFIEKGLEVTGIDLSQALLAEARERVPAAHFFEMDLRKLEFPDDAFKGVWANASLLHLNIEDIKISLGEIRRVLRPGGVVMASFKRGKGSQVILEKFSSEDSRHFTFLEIEPLTELLEEVGLTPLHAAYTNEQDQFPGLGRSLDWLHSYSKK